MLGVAFWMLLVAYRAVHLAVTALPLLYSAVWYHGSEIAVGILCASFGLSIFWRFRYCKGTRRNEPTLQDSTLDITANRYE